MLKESLSSGPGGRRALASLSCFSIHNHRHKWKENKFGGRRRGKGRWRLRGRKFQCPKGPEEDIWGNFSTNIKLINAKWINVFSCLALLRSPSSPAAFLSFWEWIPFSGARFDGADPSRSLRSNYSCPVKYHNAPKDQSTAWGAISYPLKPQFQPLWKLVHSIPWTLMNTVDDKTRTIQKIAS